MQLSFLIISVIGGLFICSFSSIFSALLLVLSTLFVVSLMYWNLINMIPLYLFSLAMLGGLYVLIGFVMMADVNDLNMVMSGKKIKEYFLAFLMIFLGLKLSSSFNNNLSTDLIGFSPITENSWSTNSMMLSVFVFLILMLFIYLFIFHSLMKSSVSGGGFVK